MSESQQEELARLRLENARLRALLADDNKYDLARVVSWQGSERDVAGDLLEELRRLAGIKDP